jgi:hypothetical protein
MRRTPVEALERSRVACSRVPGLIVSAPDVGLESQVVVEPTGRDTGGLRSTHEVTHPAVHRQIGSHASAVPAKRPSMRSIDAQVVLVAPPVTVEGVR